MAKLALSILSVKEGTLKACLNDVEPYIDWVHVDVMDGKFVPPEAMGPETVREIKAITDKFVDVHLMVENPEDMIDDFADAGADLITFHAEAYDDVNGLVRKIKSYGIMAGVAYNPKTEIGELPEGADLILLMTVEPGYGGQELIEDVLQKVSKVKEMAEGRDIEIQVDGGVNKENCADVVKHGVTNLVVGSAITGAENPSEEAKTIAERIR